MAVSRSTRLCVTGLEVLLAMGMARAWGQGQTGGAQRAPMPPAVQPQPNAGSTAAVHRLETTYVSRGLNANKDWGTFQLFFEGGGKALYLLGKATSVNLDFQGVFPSSNVPWVSYKVYKESGGSRLWAFQLNQRTDNGYVIYTKEKGEAIDPTGWQFYDFAHRYPEGHAPIF
jgi:hypothetical protein